MLLLLPLLPGLALAQRTAVLLGVEDSVAYESDESDFASVHEPKYRTIWIVADTTGALTVRASLPGIVVPRDDGWWHVGVTQVCEFDGDDKLMNERQVLWAAPVTQAGAVAARTLCTPQEAADDSVRQCGMITVDIEYVSPRLISTSTYTRQTEDCEPRGGRYSMAYAVRAFEADTDLDFGELLGTRARAAYRRALPKQAQGDMGDCDIEPDPVRQTGWRIAHSLRWRAYLHQWLGYFGCSVDAWIDFPIPAGYTGDAAVSLAIPWKQWRRRIPGVTDVLIAPRADVFVAVLPKRLQFYELRRGNPGRLLLEVPAIGIVMARWAQGEQVAQWSSEIDGLSAGHVPDPVVRAGAEPN